MTSNLQVFDTISFVDIESIPDTDKQADEIPDEVVFKTFFESVFGFELTRHQVIAHNRKYKECHSDHQPVDCSPVDDHASLSILDLLF